MLIQKLLSTKVKQKIIFCLLFLAFLANIKCEAKQHYQLSIAAIFKNDAPYLKEWIEFHRLLGVDHFYLCSHNSTDNYKKVLKPYIKKGIVELSESKVDDKGNVQCFNEDVQYHFYNKCIVKAKGVSKWVAFIDSDEFLFPVKTDSLVDFLLEFEDVAAVGINWQLFGTSNIPLLDIQKPMITQLLYCAPSNYPANVHIKSIVQPQYVSQWVNPHYALFVEGFYQVNTDHVPFCGPFSPYVQVDQVRINHYWLRDENYFWHVKVPRRLGWGDSLDGLLQIKKEINECQDTTILRFAPQLENKLKQHSL